MKTLIIFLTIVLGAFTFSCSSKNELTKGDTTDVLAIVDNTGNDQLTNLPNIDLYSSGRLKLIKTVNYRFEVKNVSKSTEAIEMAIKKYPAYISSSDLRLENPILESKITIRVQSEYFQDLLKDIDHQASFVNFRNVKTEDVAKQFVDLESRLSTKREVEERYMEILRKKAGTLKELLEAETQIGELHEEIEATISRINYLKDEVSYSTINLEFYQTISREIATAQDTSLAKQFGKAVATGWSVLTYMALGVTYLWPLLVFSCIVSFWYFHKKKTNKFKNIQAL